MSEIIFNGPAGRIEGRYYHHTQRKDHPVAIILHPHPQFGGSMNNQVTYALYRSFAKQGFNTLRFNFRGVGTSQGTFDNGVGELDDAAAALNWLQSHNPNASACWVGGFSFGAWIGMQLLMRRPELEGFISVSPPADRYDWGFLAPCPSPGLILQGENDSVVPHTAVSSLVNRLKLQRKLDIDYRRIPQADHFFTKQLDILCQHVDGYLSKNLLRNSQASQAKEAASGGKF